MINYNDFDFSVDLFKKSFDLASELHKNQKYDGQPYTVHLLDVCRVLKRHGFTEKDPEMIAAILHDALEDCAISYNDIKKLFGEEVADIVYDVTDELGKNRKERHEKTFPKTRENPKAVTVKLADRIANLKKSFDTGGGMLKKYLQEYPEFRDALYVDDVKYNRDKTLWKELDSAFNTIQLTTK